MNTSTHKDSKITPLKESYIHFVASGFIDDGKRLTHEEFARKIGVSRKTLYRWQETIPDFWLRVQSMRSKAYKLKISSIYQALYKQALKGDVNASKLLLQQMGELAPSPKNKDELLPTKIILQMGNSDKK